MSMKDDDLVFVQSLIDKELDKLYHDIESMEKQVATRRQRIDYLRNLFLDLENMRKEYDSESFDE